ncbi:MAG: DNA gyrase inhibitor YacG [Deltaproteobacteria bacterium]|nr:DNA gyrase inhibitor YacG [Deltaproteobacteria bacterium]
MRKEVICPKCRRETKWEKNPHRPFCSKRCKLIDLGLWVDERYAIPGEKGGQPPDNEELKA